MLWLRDTKDFIALAKRIVARPGPCDGIHGIYDCDYCPISEKCTLLQDSAINYTLDEYFKIRAHLFSEWLLKRKGFGQPELFSTEEDL